MYVVLHRKDKKVIIIHSQLAVEYFYEQNKKKNSFPISFTFEHMYVFSINPHYMIKNKERICLLILTKNIVPKNI